MAHGGRPGEGQEDSPECGSRADVKDLARGLGRTGAQIEGTGTNVSRSKECKGSMRRRAIEFLTRLGTASRAVIPQLASCLGDVDMNVRTAARRGLDTLEPGWQQSDTGKAIATKMVSQLSSKSLAERIAAAETLAISETDWSRLDSARDALPGLIASLAAVDQSQQNTLQTVLDRVDAEWRKTQNCTESVAILSQRLRSTDATERTAAVSGLRIFGSSAASAVGALLDRILEEAADGQAPLVQTLDAIDPKWAQSSAFSARLETIAANTRHEQAARRLAMIRLLTRVGPSGAKCRQSLDRATGG